MKARPAVATTLEDVDVVCTFCGIQMTSHLGSGAKVRYFRCGGCQRWVTSTYAEIFRADASVRRVPRSPDAEAAPDFAGVKGRLEQFLSSLDDDDPYRLLGVSPGDPPEAIRQRFRELARTHHPDRGGSAEKMSALNAAYARITQQREKRVQLALVAGT